MKNKGFTLIELLAVIIIIGVIAVITIPKVSDSLESSRKNIAQTSAYGYKNAIEEYILNQRIDENKINLQGTYNINSSDGNLYNEENEYTISYKGKSPKNGILVYNNNELVSGCITIDKYKATIANGEVTNVEKGTCQYDRMSTPAELQRLEDLKTLATAYINTVTASEFEGSGIIEISALRPYTYFNMEPPSSGWVSLLYNETNGITVFEYSLKYGANEVVTFDGTNQTNETVIKTKPSIEVLSGVDGKTIGDEIAIGTEHFYVLSYDSSTDTTTALAKSNLNVGKYKNDNFVEGMQGEVGTNYGAPFYKSCFFGDVNSPDTSYVVPQYRIGTTNKAIVYDPINYAGAPGTNNYSIAYYVEEYSNKLEISRNDLNIELRLLTKDEYTTYRPSIQTILESQRFFLGTGQVSYNSSSGLITCWVDYSHTGNTTAPTSDVSVIPSTAGIRPVIEISTSTNNR